MLPNILDAIAADVAAPKLGTRFLGFHTQIIIVTHNIRTFPESDIDIWYREHEKKTFLSIFHMTHGIQMEYRVDILNLGCLVSFPPGAFYNDARCQVCLSVCWSFLKTHE